MTALVVAEADAKKTDEYDEDKSFAGKLAMIHGL